MSLSTASFRSVEEVLYGVSVYDPYRWLEDRSLPETRHWVEAQREQCRAYLSSCGNIDWLRHRVQHLLKVTVIDQPARVGGYCFYRRRNQNDEQACVYVRDTTTGRERLLVDLSSEGPFTSVGIHRISDDGSLLAFDVRQGGGDTKEIRLVDVQSGRILPDSTGTGYSRGFAFAAANDGVYYCHESAADARHHRIVFHPLDQSDSDRIIFTRPRISGSRLALIADRSRLGAIWTRGHGADFTCDFFVAPRERDGDWRPVFVDRKLPSSPILHCGRIFVFSQGNTSKSEIVELEQNGREIRRVLESTDAPARQIVIANEQFFLSRFTDGRSSIHSWTLDGNYVGEIGMPTDGTVQILPQLASPGASFFLTHESFSQPQRLLEYSTRLNSIAPFGDQLQSIEQSSLEVRETSFTARDGTSIPLTLISRTDRLRGSVAPALMTSYGGFGVSMTPRFSVLAMIMMELGAVFAMPHIRGGGELGVSWHDAGRARNRQTAIDDFLSAAEWLCAEGISAPSKLATFGGSNSGLLVAAAMTQRPGLFRAVLCIAPLLDMVRYERFDGAARWQQEYGSVTNVDDFHALHAYSPYHRVRRNVDYPATLFVAGDRDDRCNPAHVRKMAARLQERAAQSNPILVDYSAERGHSPALPLSVRIDALVLRLAFLSKQLGIQIPSEACHEQAGR